MTINLNSNIRTIVCDITGTIAPDSMVKAWMDDFDTNGAAFLATLNDERLRQDLDIVMKEPECPKDFPAIIAYISNRVGSRIFTPQYMSLTGAVNVEGYQNGRLESQLFEDVPAALRSWQADGRISHLYSQGSAAMQAEIVRRTQFGDLRRFLGSYLDTAIVGSKTKSSSYQMISRQLDVNPANIVFLSDRTNELIPAREAGFETVYVVRPGNKQEAPEATDSFKHATSFDQINFD